MGPIRVLQVVTIMNCGGLETMLMNYYRQMDRSQIQFDFMVHRTEEGHYDQEIKELGGRIFPMSAIRPGKYRVYFRELDSFFKKHPEYKVVHSHVNENSSFVLRAAKRAGIPSRIAHSHTSNLGLDYKLIFRLYARLTMRGQPTDYFACSKDAGKWLFGKKIMNSGKVKILNNAINIKKFKKNLEIRNSIRKQLNISNKFVLGHVGRFNRSKNHEYLLKVFIEVYNYRNDAVLILIGDGERKNAIKDMVNSMGLDQSVLFMGIRKNVPEILQAMDIFLFPSFFEGFPVSLIEAQAASLQCIISDTISRECDLTGKTKFLSIKDEPNKWAETILNSSVEKKLSQDFESIKQYDITSNATKLFDYYVSAIC